MSRSKPATKQTARTRPGRLLVGLVGVVGIAIALFAIADVLFGIRDRISRAPAYAPVGPTDEEHERAAQAIRSRIGLLLKPRDGKMVLGGDRSGRLIEAGLLYGRLSLLEEKRGNLERARSEMAEAVALLRSAGHPEPTEAHIREAIVRQDARRKQQ